MSRNTLFPSKHILRAAITAILLTVALISYAHNIEMFNPLASPYARPFAGKSMTAYGPDRRFQIMALSNELNPIPGGARIFGISFFCPADGSSEGTFSNVVIELCHTSLGALTSTFASNYDGNTPSQVYSNSTLHLQWRTNDWNMLFFDTPFPYNTVDGLIIEIRYTDNDGNSLHTEFWSAGIARILDASDSTAVSGTTQSIMLNFRVYYSTATDEDNDGIDDSWEITFFSNTNTWSGNDDADNDGIINLNEYIAGTNPTNIQHFFSIQDYAATLSNDCSTLSWQSYADRFYTVISSSNLSTWSNVKNKTYLSGTGSTMSHTNTSMSTNSLNYNRVTVRYE